MNIRRSVESPRGCGYRKPGGKYLVSGGTHITCYKLPIELTICPVCHAGIKFSRGWTWVGKELVDMPCPHKECMNCVPFDGSVDKMGLMWVGEKYYTPREFIQEAINRGVSKRISGLPRDFILGETWILLAHKKVPVNGSEEFIQGIFYAFKPTKMEYIIHPNDSVEKLKRLEAQGWELLEVVPEAEQTEIKRDEFKGELVNYI